MIKFKPFILDIYERVIIVLTARAPTKKKKKQPNFAMITRYAWKRFCYWTAQISSLVETVFIAFLRIYYSY